MKKLIIISFCSLFFVSCACNKHHVSDLSTFPPSQSWVKWGKDPVKKDNGDGTVVVDENVVAYAAQAKKWIERVEKWKIKNQIP